MMNWIRRKEVQNAGWLIAGKIAQMVISLFVSLLTARYLGPGNYGLLSYAAAYTAFFFSLCTLGINSVIVKEMIDEPRAEGEILGTALLLRAVASICSAGVILAIVSAVDAGEPTTILVVALSSLGMVFHVFETLNYWFQARLESKVTAIATFAAYAVTSAYRVFLIVTGKSVAYFALALTVDHICSALVLLYAYHKRGGQDFSFTWIWAKRLLGKSCHFILSGLMVSVYGQTDKFMLKQMLGEGELGCYSVALAVCNLWCFVLNAVITSLTPGIMQAHSENPGLFERKNRQLYAIVFYLSAAVSLVLTLFAPLVIRVLYGEAYLAAAAPLRVVTWYTAFSYLGVARNPWVVCQNCQKYLKYIYLITALANVALNGLLIPPLGAVGAAAASLLTQMLVIAVPLLFREMGANSRLILEAMLLRGVFLRRGVKTGKSMEWRELDEDI